MSTDLTIDFDTDGAVLLAYGNDNAIYLSKEAIAQLLDKILTRSGWHRETSQ